MFCFWYEIAQLVFYTNYLLNRMLYFLNMKISSLFEIETQLYAVAQNTCKYAFEIPEFLLTPCVINN